MSANRRRTAISAFNAQTSAAMMCGMENCRCAAGKAGGGDPSRNGGIKMKVLVYGAGVIGCYLTHVLCQAGNDVTLLARGQWKRNLEANGLNIRHSLQKVRTTDHPRIADALGNESYDAVFAVMQHQQMLGILDDLAKANAPMLVLVGNNMSAPEMEAHIQAHTKAPKTVLFGFQGTGGRRENGQVDCVRFGGGSMSIGGLRKDVSEEVKTSVAGLFRGTKYQLTWVSDMDAWYKCHLAFILPICYLSYLLGCDLTRCTRQQLRQGMDAVREGYGLLSALNYPILPEDTMDSLTGVKGALSYCMMWIMAKTAIGRLAATDHCRHAVTEMEGLENGWNALRAARPDFPMPHWDALRSAMPGWAELHQIYDESKEPPRE